MPIVNVTGLMPRLTVHGREGGCPRRPNGNTQPEVEVRKPATATSMTSLGMKETAGNKRTKWLKRPNGFGLYDTLGNVEDWVNDWFDEHYYENSPLLCTSGPAGGQERVLRGGVALTPMNIRVSGRLRENPDGKVPNPTFRDSGDLGFRCAAEVLGATPTPPGSFSNCKLLSRRCCGSHLGDQGRFIGVVLQGSRRKSSC